MKFRERSTRIDGSPTRFTDTLPAKESSEKYDPLVPPADLLDSGENESEPEQAKIDRFQAASDAKRGRKSPPSRDELAKLSSIECFKAMSDYRRGRR